MIVIVHWHDWVFTVFVGLWKQRRAVCGIAVVSSVGGGRGEECVRVRMYSGISIKGHFL